MRISDDPLQRSRITGWREAWTGGVLLASVLPLLLALPPARHWRGFRNAVCVKYCCWVSWHCCGARLARTAALEEIDWWLLWRNAAFLRLALVFC